HHPPFRRHRPGPGDLAPAGRTQGCRREHGQHARRRHHHAPGAGAAARRRSRPGAGGDAGPDRRLHGPAAAERRAGAAGAPPGAGTAMRLALVLPRGDEADLEPEAMPDPTEGFMARPLPSVEQALQERSLVLIVHDHPTNRLVVGRQLQLAGYASETAEDGVKGLEAWRSGRYALVLSDVHMPHMDGYEMARAIRDEELRSGKPRTPVIALTAAALEGEAEGCLSAG